jgi:hypothetical protein
MLQLAIVFSLLGYTPPEWTSKYDRFDDITMMMSSTELVGGRSTVFIIAAMHKGKVVTEENQDAHYSIQFWMAREGWTYLECHSVAMLIDGKRVRLPAADHEGDVISGRLVSETIKLTATKPLIAAIAEAKVVEVQVCNDEWRLPQKVIDGAKRVIASTSPQTKGDPAPVPQPAPVEPSTERRIVGGDE